MTATRSPLLLAALMAAACGGQTQSGGSAGSGGAAGTAGVGGAGGTPGSTSFDVTVLDLRDQPISDAIVVLDAPGGVRVEAKTDALGVASFAPVDFAGGTVDVTAFSPGYVLTTVMDVGATSSTVIHLVPTLESSQAIWMKTVVVNVKKLASSDCVTVSSDGVGGHSCGDAVDVSVPGGFTGKLLALEHGKGGSPSSSPPPPPLKAAVQFEVPTTGSSIDVDFSKSLPIEHASGSIQVPDSGTFELTHLQVDVTSRSAPLRPYAALSTFTPPSGALANWDVDFVRPFPDAEAATKFAAGVWPKQDKGNQSLVGVAVAGYPGAATPPPLPSPPRFDPSSSSPSLFEPIAWHAGSDADRPEHIVVNGNVGSEAVWAWIVWFSPARDSLTLRKPPDSIASAFEMTNADFANVALEMCACEEPCEPTHTPWCSRWAISFADAKFDPTPL